MVNSSCSASRRDDSINRPRKKVQKKQKRLVTEVRLRRGDDFGFGKRQTGHFHDANSIRLPITSLPAYALLTIVCFFSALSESTVVPLPEKSLPVPHRPGLGRESENVTKFSTSSDRCCTRAEFCTLLSSHCRVRSTGQSR